MNYRNNYNCRLNDRNFRNNSVKHNVIRKGDVCIMNNMAFEQDNMVKTRPVIITDVSGDDLQYMKCTSQKKDDRQIYQINDIKSSGLDKTTYVYLNKYSTKKNRLSIVIGHLSQQDMQNIEILLNVSNIQCW